MYSSCTLSLISSISRVFRISSIPSTVSRYNITLCCSRTIQSLRGLRFPRGWAVERASLYPQAAMYWVYLPGEEEFWKRCWIIQEVGMASSVRIYFGSQSIPWVEFIKLVNWYRVRHRKANVNNILKLDALRKSMYLDRGTFSLARL